MSARRNKTRTAVLSLVFFLMSAAGCHKQAGKDPGSARTYHIKGLVMALQPARKRIVIAHEEIPQYMKAMTMPFSMPDTTRMQGIEVGDSVRGLLVVEKSGAWLDSVVVIAKVPQSETR
ncbi:MAG: copper-binding protein [Ignavibacteriales bacterium]|nr:copper-binding protein [Ignavibacteriales bacterium]